MQTEDTRTANSGQSFQGTVATVFAAYVSNNAVAREDIEQTMQKIAAGLRSVESTPTAGSDRTNLEPAIAIKKSVTPEHIICLEDGKKFKSLKRHLRTRYGMTPDQYRSKWGLPADYPMVAPNYAKERSNLAKKMGLGHAQKRED